MSINIYKKSVYSIRNDSAASVDTLLIYMCVQNIPVFIKNRISTFDNSLFHVKHYFQS